MLCKSVSSRAPVISPLARIAENATLIGDVTLKEDVSVWYGCVLRADIGKITIGAGSNLQDNVTVHIDKNCPVSVGKNVTIGHGAILHGCTIEDNCLIGMGAILLNGCHIGIGSIIAAGALVTQNTNIPAGSLVMGSPAKVRRPLTAEETQEIAGSALEYQTCAKQQLPGAVQDS